ncbi:hypothetical protein PR202_ga20972 [Eleusine coracana subsp. coracana]|uniref:CCHC-type domain-containing protein n=1 Tax=Eleusine coracana subsp. coracana TaxID=191504 RepID=A0AAV5D053_ELECO|nr:hypothetical protein PR202_ga20972 [Eleusine coracana subsp. coracana]
MASLPVITPLDGGDGYLCWKETLLLHLNTVGVAHVLSEDPPPPSGIDGNALSSPAAAARSRRRWAREDAVCRGHILAALSDRLLPDCAHHGTARALWEAVAPTYDFAADCVAFRRFNRFDFDDDAPVLEQLAHVQALATFLRQPGFSADFVARVVHGKLPAHKCFPAKKGESMTMEKVWEEARFKDDIREEMLMAWNPERHQCWNCMRRGHIRKNCTMPARC